MDRKLGLIVSPASFVLAASLTLQTGCLAKIDSETLEVGESTAVPAAQIRGKFKLIARSSGAEDLTLVRASMTIGRIEIHTVDGTWYRFTTDPVDVDLLNLNVGVGSVLARVNLPEGGYDKIRFITQGVGEAELSDGTVMPLRVPSGDQTGIKVHFDPPLKSVGGKITAALLEFQLKNAFVATADEMHFKPVVRVKATEIVDPNAGSGTTPDDGTGTTPDDGSGTTPDDGSGTTPDDGSGSTPDDGTGTTPDDGSGAVPDDGTGTTPDDGTSNDTDGGGLVDPVVDGDDGSYDDTIPVLGV